METMSLVIEALVAAGTVAVAILAIWGDWFRAVLVPPRLSIQPHDDFGGTLTKFSSPDDRRVLYYYLKVVNSRPWSPARNCRVLLRGILGRAANQEFVPLPMIVPAQFIWAPAQLTPSAITLSKEQIIDFGRLTEGSDCFEPTLYSYANDFRGRVSSHGAIRYILEIVADGFVASKYQVFEVAWDGKWTENLDEMKHSLTIREISENTQ